MSAPLLVEQFLQSAESTPVIDVRSPAEFDHGHIPGAHNIPLFENEERAVIGTLYKKKGRDEAVLEGLRIVGPKMASFVEKARSVAPDNEALVHCWRGGMRSSSFAWLLEQAGMNVHGVMKNGYKAYRRHVQFVFSQELELVVVGGRTGTGKTDILKALERAGEQIVDLEGLAHHKGSAFGALGQLPQPHTEHFENLMHHQLKQIDPTKRIWVEDESALVGLCRIPVDLFKQMRAAPLAYLDLPMQVRVKRLVKEYGPFTREQLADPILRIGKRLGGQHVKAALEALDAGDLAQVAEISLKYYDKAYERGTATRDPAMVQRIPIDTDDPERTATLLIKEFNEHNRRDTAHSSHAVQ